MTKRLQVLLEDDEIARVQEAARARRQTTAEWVRQALRASLERERAADPAAKLEALVVASRYSSPISDIEQLLAEVEAGYVEVVEE